IGEPRTGLGHHEGLEADRAEKAIEEIDDEHRVELAADLLRLLPHGLDRFADGQVDGHRDQLGGHDAAGGFLVVLEQLAELAGLFAGQRGQDPGLLLRRQLADQVDGIVVRQLGDELADPFGFERGEERLRPLLAGHLGEGFRGDAGREQVEQQDPILLVQLGEEVREVARMEFGEVNREAIRVAGIQHAPHLREPLPRIFRDPDLRHIPHMASRAAASCGAASSPPGRTAPAERMYVNASSIVMCRTIVLSRGTTIRNPVVGFGTVGMKTVTFSSGGPGTSPSALPVTNPTDQIPSEGYSTRTTCRKNRRSSPNTVPTTRLTAPYSRRATGSRSRRPCQSPRILAPTARSVAQPTPYRIARSRSRPSPGIDRPMAG